MAPDTGPRPSRRRSNVPIAWALCLVAVSFLAGGGIGWWLGRISASPEARAMATVLEKLGPAADGRPASTDSLGNSQRPGDESLGESWSVALQLASRVRSLEALLKEFQSQEGDPKQILRRAVEDFSEGELELVLGTAVRLDSDELAEIEDLPGFANSLIDVAMSGLVEPDEDVADQAAIYFTRTPERNDPAAVGRTVFKSSEHRIYAVFSSGGYRGPKVMVKWFRTDPPNILAFGRYSITPDRAYSWVWLEQTDGWDAGQYQVDVYSGDEAMHPIARGRFSVE